MWRWQLLLTNLEQPEAVGNSLSDRADRGEIPSTVYAGSRYIGDDCPGAPGVHTYHSIPYAVPPVGSRRWAEPEAARHNMGDLDNTRAGIPILDPLSASTDPLGRAGPHRDAVCIQFDSSRRSTWNETFSSQSEVAVQAGPLTRITRILREGLPLPRRVPPRN